MNVGLFVLAMSLVGARIFYILENNAYYAANLIESPQIWLGGLSWPGALIGAWLAMLFVSRTQRIPGEWGNISMARLGDRLYPLLPSLGVSVWLGCWQAGIAYGQPLPAGAWWGNPGMDEMEFLPRAGRCKWSQRSACCYFMRSSRPAYARNTRSAAYPALRYWGCW
jgi:prolipoprotein diacylglyceryltransferase